MKLSDRNNAVHFLLDGDPMHYTAPSGNRASEFIYREFARLRPLFRQNIQYMCKSFQEAFQKGYQKVYNSLQEEPIRQSGTLIVPGIEAGNLTVFYSIDSKGSNKNHSTWILDGCIIAFITKRNFAAPALFFCHQFIDGHIFSTFGPDFPPAGPLDTLNHHQYFICLILFPQFCETETKIIEAGKKSLHKNEKYVNDTKLPIEILDSTWFTTIIRTQGFMVGEETFGYFRWQHYGPGLSQKKIIWIAPYEKKGYTRKAKILMKDT